MMEFEKNQVYDFTVKRVEFFDGEPYFVLAYEGQETMPGYEDDGWVFRVRMLPFQKSWSKDAWLDMKMPCFVKHYKRDAWGYETTFPYLIQDQNHLLESHYQEGDIYDFEICDRLEGEGSQAVYLVRDNLGLRHKLWANAEEMAYEVGGIVSLRVRKIEKGTLKFDRAHQLDLPGNFQLGESYEFEIMEERTDLKTAAKFFSVKDRKIGALHRFYYRGDQEASEGDTITLRVKAISEDGYLQLESLVEPTTQDALVGIAEYGENQQARSESLYLEYKSSFVYTAKGECNIDKQLGGTIMKEIAAFMNAEGGELLIGYEDDGTVCGIDKDLPFINESQDDPWEYDWTEDKICLKFNNTIAAKLGNLASSHALVKLYRREDLVGRQVLVCHITVQKSLVPVWVQGKALYIRSQTSARRLLGSDITAYICGRCGGAPAVVSQPQLVKPIAEVSDEVKPIEEKADLSSLLPKPIQKTKEIWKYITLYKDGKASQQSMSVDNDSVLCNIAINNSYKKKNGRLLLCYDNGRVNVLSPKTVVSEKLTTASRLYRRGYNAEKGVKLLHALVCAADDYLVIRSRKENGREMVKAVPVASCTVCGGKSMDAKGNIFVKTELATPVYMQIVPASHMSFIYGIICKSSEKYGPGHAVDSEFCRNIMNYLERQAKSANPVTY